MIGYFFLNKHILEIVRSTRHIRITKTVNKYSENMLKYTI